ncbi:MAG: MerR family transcriptional regulator [Gammaproteobacteria bacterium]|nr:MerR family transcriptional regulator [Gammaproteobacteria bacterium]MCY4199201.1 MerR family transcriptional regulator [Gammaproteobacteria bacterium]MCY4323468.1 MerR family transcriptional regulator [Gammaproteobacteria bacterium]
MSDPEEIYADSPKAESKLEPVPDKLYFTIGEVSKLCEVPAHVLRYWERKVPDLSQVSRRNNRRYYRREDVVKARRIRALIYEQGMTIQGAVQALNATHAANATSATVASDTAGKSRREPTRGAIGAIETSAGESGGRVLREVCESLKEVSRMLSKGLRRSD